jgi:sortase A
MRVRTGAPIAPGKCRKQAGNRSNPVGPSRVSPDRRQESRYRALARTIGQAGRLGTSPDSRYRRPVRRTANATGRVLITVGTLVLLFVAYQLWGTGIYESREQSRLRSQLNQDIAKAKRANQAVAGTTTTTLPPVPPPEGDAVGFIDIPRIGLSRVVVQGVAVPDLRKGPGHDPTSPMPGQLGNAFIAGHRTTYGAPFGDLDQLGVGDVIKVATVQGKFTYKVTEQRVVDPSEVSVLDPTPDPARPGHDLATLTLTTCNPKYSAEQRLIIKAQLTPEAAPLPRVATPKGSAVVTINGLSGESSSRTPAIIWGLIAAVVGLLWWLLFHRHPRWTTWLIGVVPFLVVLFVCYMYVERLLPSNY